MAQSGLKQRFRSLIAGFVVALLPGFGSAQDEDEQAPDLHVLEEAPSLASRGIPLKVRFRSDTRFVVGSDFGASDANLYWPRGYLQVGVPLSERAAVRVRLNGGAAIYDFDGSTDLFGAGPSSREPFDELYSGTFALEGRYLMNEKWALYGQGFAAARWEEGGVFDDSIVGGGGMAIGYQIPDRFKLILGGGLKSRLDRSSLGPYPLIDLEWMISDAWRLRIHGPGALLEYAFSDAFKVFLRGQLTTRSYRLGERLGAADRGTVRDRQVPVGLGFRWVAHRNFRIGVSAGVMAEHKLKIRDRHRNTIGSISADPAPYLELQIDLRP